MAQFHLHPTAIPSRTWVPPHCPPVPPARHRRVPSAAVIPPTPGHAAASPSLLPWRAGEGTGRLRGFGDRCRSWERFSHNCPGRGEHVRLRHEASPSLVSTSRPPLCQRAGNPFGRCQLSQEPWQCQLSYFPHRPANKGFLPPPPPSLLFPAPPSLQEVFTYYPVQDRASLSTSLSAFLPVAPKCLSSFPAGRCQDVPHSIQLSRLQSLSWL